MEDRSVPPAVAQAAARVRHWLRLQPAGSEIEGMVMSSDRPRPGAGITEFDDCTTVFVDHSVSASFRSGVLEAITIGYCDLWRRGIGVDLEVVENTLDTIIGDVRWDLAERRKAILEESSSSAALLAA